MKTFYISIFVIALAINLQTSRCDVCQTDICKKLAGELKTIMNKSVNPCDDFSSYVCGNFNKLHSIPPGEATFDWMVDINNKVSRELKKILENQDLSNKNLPQTKAAMFYKSCTNMNARNKNSNPTLKAYAENLIKDDYDDNLIKLLKAGLFTSMLTFYVLPDLTNSEVNILFIDKPHLILPEASLKTRESEDSKKQIENYLKYMEKVFDIIGLWTNEKSSHMEIIELQIRLAKSLPSINDQMNPSNYKKISIQDLQTRCPALSWKKVINGVLQNTGKQLKDSDQLLVFSLDYIDSMCSLVTEYKANPRKKLILQKEMAWRAISSLVPFGSESLVKALDDLVSQVFGTTGSVDLWKKCLDLTAENIIDVIGNMYIKNYFPASKKQDIEFMIKNLISTFKEALNRITWMDSNTKSSALKKLTAMKYKIGYPESLLSETKLMKDNEKVSMKLDYFMENYIKYQEIAYNSMVKEVGERIPEDKWEMAAHQVNAYYNPNANEIVFPAAILQYPFYDIDLPVSYNYGAIGMVLGHEILHGFDTIGSQFDEKGLIKDWWSPASKREYEAKIKCISDQYGKYELYGQRMFPDHTLSEDIADNAGMRIAFEAAFSSSENRKKLTLPGLDFTAKQLFFVAEARAWCSLMTRNGAMDRIQNDEHTIWKFRINGPMSNIPEFSSQFKCERSSQMNNLKKCLVW